MADPIFNVVSLCSGVGGLDLGVKLAVPSARTVCYVEREAYAVAVLAARMQDGSLDEATVWSDLLTFDGRPWRGRVDCIIAGFPCQPWSHAGKRKGTDDDRWLWPAIARIIDDAKPAMVFLENVPGLVSGGGLHHVLDDLAEMGFDAEWLHLTASAVGASHKRNRVFILGFRGADMGDAGDVRQRRAPEENQAWPGPGDGRGTVAHSGRIGDAGRRDARDVRGESGLDDTQPERLQGQPCPRPTSGATVGTDGMPDVPPERNDHAAWRRILTTHPYLAPAIEPGLRVLADGMALVVDKGRTDQLRAAGNGVVPIQAAAAFVELVRRGGVML